MWVLLAIIIRRFKQCCGRNFFCWNQNKIFFHQKNQKRVYALLTNKQTYKHTNIQTYKHTSIQTHKHTNAQTYKQAMVKSRWQLRVWKSAIVLVTLPVFRSLRNFLFFQELDEAFWELNSLKEKLIMSIKIIKILVFAYFGRFCALNFIDFECLKKLRS